MLCLPCNNGGCKTSPRAIPSILLLQSASLLIEWPRHLKGSSLRLSSELPSAVLAFLAPLLLVPVISSKSEQQLLHRPPPLHPLDGSGPESTIKSFGTCSDA